MDLVQEFKDGKITYRCRKIQIIQRHDRGNIAITASEVRLTPALSAILGSTANMVVDVDSKIRKLFFEICKKAKSEVKLTEGLAQIYDTNADVRESAIFKTGDNGELIFDMAKNRDLRNFRDSATEVRREDDGMLKRVGTTPSKFLWQPKPTLGAMKHLPIDP